MTTALSATVKKLFQRTPLTEAEQALKQWHIEYTKQDDGTIVVEGDVDIGGRRLKKLPDLTKVIVRRSFYCNNNQLTSLAGAPASVCKSFLCHNNQLTSLAGAPASVGGSFWCEKNLLTSLEGAPQEFKALFSDFGDFTSWNEVPEHLRISPQTIVKAEKEKQARLETLNRIGAASSQKQRFKPMPSIRFKAEPK